MAKPVEKGQLKQGEKVGLAGYRVNGTKQGEF